MKNEGSPRFLGLLAALVLVSLHLMCCIFRVANANIARGWKVEVYEFDPSDLNANSVTLDDVEEHLIHGTKKEFVWDEINVPQDEEWPDLPVRPNGEEAHQYFYARFSGIIKIGEDNNGGRQLGESPTGSNNQGGGGGNQGGGGGNQGGGDDDGDEGRKAGNYRFLLNSKDGSQLFVDGELAVDRDGRHSSTGDQCHSNGNANGQKPVRLEEGEHSIQVRYFLWTGDSALKVKWRLGGGPCGRNFKFLGSDHIEHFEPRLPRLFFHGPTMGGRLQTEIPEAKGWGDGGVSLSLWAKTRSEQSQSILSIVGMDSSEPKLMILNYPETRLTVVIGDHIVETDFVIADGRWHHIVVIWHDDSEDGIDVVVDGDRTSSKDVPGAGEMGQDVCFMLAQRPILSDLESGAVYECGTVLDVSSQYEGYLSSILVWNKELGSEQIQTLGRHQLDDDSMYDDLLFGYVSKNLTREDEQDFSDVSSCGISGTGQEVVKLVDVGKNQLNGELRSDDGALPTFFRAGHSFPVPRRETEDIMLWLTADDNLDNFKDFSGHEHETELVGDVKFGTADDSQRLPVMEMCWDGHAEIPGLRNFDWSESFTLSIFYRRLVGSRDQSFVGNGLASSSDGGSVEIHGTEDFEGNHVGVDVQLNGGSTSRKFTSTASLEYWHNAALVYRADENRLIWYVDGVCVGKRAPSPGSIPTVDEPLFVGAASSSGLHRMCGQVHDVRVYTRSLEHTEIKELYEEMFDNFFFGERLGADCVVSKWGAWSECAPAEELFEGVVENGTHMMRVRSREVTEGSLGCPHLREWERCDADIMVSAEELVMDNTHAKALKIRLSSEPFRAGTVSVTLDTSGNSLFSVSQCELTFTQEDWNQWKTVAVVPRASTFSESFSEQKLVLRAHNYGTAFEWRTDVTAGDNQTLLLPEESRSRVIEKDVIVHMHHLERGRAHCRSWGDPHIITFDSNKYDFFGVGDYYLVRSCDGQFVVQVRQRECFSVSCNEAVVIKYRSQVIAFHVDDRSRTNPVRVLRRSNDGDSGKLYRIGPGGSETSKYRYTAPDGSRVEVQLRSWKRFHYLNVDVHASARHWKNVNGLCGLWNGDKDSDFIGPDGFKYGSKSSVQDRKRHRFGMLWLVADEENLFVDPNATISEKKSVGYTGDGKCYSPEVTVDSELLCDSGEKISPDPVDEFITSDRILGEIPTPGVGQPFSSGPSYRELSAPRYECIFESSVVEDEVRSTCSNAISNSTIGIYCRDEAGIDLDSHFQTCVNELCFVGSRDAIGSVLDTMLEECVDRLQDVRPSQSPTPSITPSPSSSRDPFSGPDDDSPPRLSPSKALTPSTTSSPSIPADFASVPTASNTPSITSTPSITPSSSFSPTATLTSTGTSTPSNSASRTLTPTSTLTRTHTSTRTSTPTVTTSSTTSVTPSHSPSGTSSRTGSATGTSTASSSQSKTQTASPTSSGTGTSTSTMTGSASLSATSSATVSPTSTTSSSPSGTSSSSHTRTPSSSMTPTASVSVTSTSSTTPTVSSTSTPSSSGSSTGTPTVTITPSETASQTSSRTSSLTASTSSSPSSTSSVSGTSSVTSSPTPSSTGSSTASRSVTSSNTNTASLTASASASQTSASTASPTSTPSHTVTPTVSISPTETASPSSSSTASLTASTSSSPTSTTSSTSTSSETGTPSVTTSSTPSNTGSPTGTPSTSGTPDSTRTASQSITPSNTKTPSVTASPSSTLSPTSSTTSTLTSSSTSTPSNTESSTATPTATISSSETASQTSTRTPSWTATRSSSPSSTASSTSTSSPTESPSGTPSSTGSSTGSPSKSRTATSSVSASNTVTATVTTSPSGTSSPSSSSTGTLTASHTVTSSPSQTESPTLSSTSSSTASSSSTPSGTPSRTSTLTETPSSTVSRTPSKTASHSSTQTASFTSTPSKSPSSSSSVSSSSTASSTGTSTASPSSSSSSTATQTTTVSPSSSSSPSGSVSPSSSRTASASNTASPSTSATSSTTATQSASSSTSATVTASVTPTSSSTGTPTHSLSSTPSGSATITASSSVTPSHTGSLSPTSSVTASGTASPSMTPSFTPSVTATPTSEASPGCLDLTIRQQVELCPSWCSGNGVCTCDGCACDHGWTGSGCSLETNKTNPVIDEFQPDDGILVPGQPIEVSGEYLAKSELANKGGGPYKFNDTVGKAYDCVIRNRLGEFVARFPFQVDEDTRGHCVLPTDVDFSVYGTDEDNMEYSEIVDPNLVCPLVPPRQKVWLGVILKEHNLLVAENQYMLVRCRPRGSQISGVDCENGGICSNGGLCVCPPGWCGSRCNVRTNFNGCGGNDHPNLAFYNAMVFKDWQHLNGSEVEGLLAVGGDSRLQSYAVGDGWPEPEDALTYRVDSTKYTDRDDLAVRGTLTFTSGAVLSGGNMIFGPSSLATDRASVEAPGTKIEADPKFPFAVDFDGVQIATRRLSERLASLPRTATAYMEFTTLYLKGTREDINVFQISASDLFHSRTIDLDLTTLGEKESFNPFATGADYDPSERPFIPPPGQWNASRVPTTVINVIWNDTIHNGYGIGQDDVSRLREKNISQPGLARDIIIREKGLTGHFYRPNSSASIIWNFPVAERLSIGNIDLRGSVLAPGADVHFPSGQMLGNLWARSFIGDGTVRLPLYRGTCSPKLVDSLIEMNGGLLNFEWLDRGSDIAIQFKTRELSEESVDTDRPILGNRGEEISRLADLVGKFGSPPIPDCRPYGRMNDDYECDCWDPTFRRGPECRTRCVDYCHGRGMCNASNPNVCDCFDPIRWTGDRCERSRCGENGWVEEDPTNTVENVTCRCMHGWTGPRCSVLESCQHGAIRGDVCVCDAGWSGQDCSVPLPEPVACYQGQVVSEMVKPREDGPEVRMYKCQCREGWTGKACSIPSGERSKDCFFGHKNDTDGRCVCDPMWAGEECNVRACQHGTVVKIDNTGGMYGSLAELERAVLSGDAQAAQLLPDARTLAAPREEGKTTIRLSDREPLRACICEDEWFGPACTLNCRAACNFRGSACTGQQAGLSLGNITEALSSISCACDGPWTGERCEQFSMPKPDVAEKNEFVGSSVEVSYVPEAETAASNERLRGRRLEVAKNSMNVSVYLQGAAWNRTNISLIAGANEEVSEQCEVFINSDNSVTAGLDAVGFGPDNGVFVYCLPVQIGFTTDASEEEVRIKIELEGDLKDVILRGGDLSNIDPDDDDQFMYAALVDPRAFEGVQSTFSVSSSEDYDPSSGVLDVSVTIDAETKFYLAVLQPDAGTRSEIVAQATDTEGDDDDSSSSGTNVTAIAGGVAGGSALIAIIAAAFLYPKKRRKSSVAPNTAGRASVAWQADDEVGDEDINIDADDEARPADQVKTMYQGE